MSVDPQDKGSLTGAMDAFEAAWQRGAAPEIADFLPSALDAHLRRQFLIQLIMVDLEMRWKRPVEPAATIDLSSATSGVPTSAPLPVRPSLEDYLQRYPNLGRLAELPDDLVAHEFRVRWQWGDRPVVEGYRRRFGTEREPLWPLLEAIIREQETGRFDPSLQGTQPWSPARRLKIRCPHCHNPVEIVDEQSVTDITCPSCQAVFSLVGSPAGAAGDGAGPRQFGHFELLERLGHGAFGEVWKARDTQLERTVAIKIPRRTQLDAEDIEKFIREARAAAQLKHPNIVSVHEVGREGNTVYIVSDYIAGVPLDRWLAGERKVAGSLREPSARVPSNPLPPREAAELCRKIALALHHAHEAGIVHRDLKPSNIMMDAAGEPHVMDFGLAKREAGEITMTVEGQILGTPAYMSPEQARGESHAADRCSDVYSLGVILFELLTGERPFRGNIRMLLQQVLEDPPPSPRKLDARIPKDLETLTLKCLGKEPARRYPTALALADELDHFLHHKPILARPINRTERAWRWCKRNPAVAGLSTAVALALCAGIVATSMFAVDAQREKRAAIANEKETIAALARSNYFLADARWKENRVDEAFSLLESVPPEHRRFEWYLARRQFFGSDITLYGHLDRVTSVAFSPDGASLASASADNTVKLWDARTGAEIRTLTGHSRTVYSVAFSPNGASLASASADNTVKLWDARTGAEIRTLAGHKGEVSSVTFSPDGARLASASADQTVRLWDARTGAEIRTLAEHSFCVAFSPDGARLASASADNTVRLWDARTGAEIRSLTGHSGWVTSVAFSPDGARLASASADQTIKLWDARTGAEIRTLTGHSRLVHSVAFCPDGARLASASADQTIKLWDARTGAEIRTLTGHSNGVTSVAFSPDGARLASANQNQTVKLWDARTGAEIRTLTGHSHFVTSVAFSPDGARLASASYDQTVKLWDTRTGVEIRTLTGHSNLVTSVVFSPDGARLASASADQTIKLWDARTGAEIRTLTGHSRLVHSVAFSPDGARLASASADQTVKLWDARTGAEIRTLTGHSSWVQSVAFSPDGALLASANQNQTANLWDARTGAEIRTLTGHQGSVHSVAFSFDGARLASAGWDQTVKLWDGRTGAEIHTLTGHSTREVTSVVFSPDGALLASASRDYTVKLWDARTGTEIRTLTGHKGEVSSVVFSPDGARLASASFDKTVKLWEARARSEIRALTGHKGEVSSVVFSPDGAQLASASWDKTVKLRDARTGAEIHTLTGHKGGVPSVAFSPDGAQLASASWDKTAKLWDARTGTEIHTLTGHSKDVTSVAFSPDGTRLSSIDSKQNCLTWNVTTGVQISNSDRRPESLPRSDRTADGKWLAVRHGTDVWLVDLTFKDDPDEKAYREFKAKLDPWWHEERAYEAEQEGANRDWYSALFHLAWLLKIRPDDTDAHDRLHRAYDAFKKDFSARAAGSATAESSDEKRTPVSTNPDDYLAPVVREMLKLPRGDGPPLRKR